MSASKEDIAADCALMKVGRTLIVGEVSLYSEGSNDLVAHVVGTFPYRLGMTKRLDKKLCCSIEKHTIYFFLGSLWKVES